MPALVGTVCAQSTETKARTMLRNGEPHSFVTEKKRDKRSKNGASRRLAKHAACEARKRQKEALVAAGTYNVLTLTVEGKNGYGHDKRVLAKDQQLGCDFTGLQKS